MKNTILASLLIFSVLACKKEVKKTVLTETFSNNNDTSNEIKREIKKNAGIKKLISFKNEKFLFKNRFCLWN